MTSRGIYIVAYGDHARGCAEALMDTICQEMPGTPIAVASDKRVGSEDVLVRSKQRDNGARWQKTKIWDLAPAEWEQIIYLDADILLAKSLQPMWDILDAGWDMAMTVTAKESPTIGHGQRRNFPKENRETAILLGSTAYPQLAGGVWGFQRNERTHAFFAAWHKEWLRYGARDQQAMDRALYASPVSVWVLGQEFNWFVHCKRPTDAVHVLHFATAARAWVEKQPGRQLCEQYQEMR